MISRLIKLIKLGPNIRFCHFTDQVIFMSISLLRAFIEYGPSTKSQLMNDKPKDDIKSILNLLLDYLRPEKVQFVRSDIEDSILSLLI